jgi:hypothetical protein
MRRDSRSADGGSWDPVGFLHGGCGFSTLFNRPSYQRDVVPASLPPGRGGGPYSVRTFNQDSSLTTTPGWDDVTGIGVPTPNDLTSLKGR